jgi:hypothetical protein
MSTIGINLFVNLYTTAVMISCLLLIPQKKKKKKKKKAVVVTARVHPGETPASWMMKGFMDFLTGDSLQARVSELLSHIAFHYRPVNLKSLYTILAVPGMRCNASRKPPSRSTSHEVR